MASRLDDQRPDPERPHAVLDDPPGRLADDTARKVGPSHGEIARETGQELEDDDLIRPVAETQVSFDHACASKAGLLRDALRRQVVGMCRQQQPPDAPFVHGPARQQPERTRRNAAIARARGDPVPGRALFSEPHVDRSEERVRLRIGDRKRDPVARARPLARLVHVSAGVVLGVWRRDVRDEARGLVVATGLHDPGHVAGFERTEDEVAFAKLHGRSVAGQREGPLSRPL